MNGKVVNEKLMEGENMTDKEQTEQMVVLTGSRQGKEEIMKLTDETIRLRDIYI